MDDSQVAPEVARAAETVDQVAERVGDWASGLTLRLYKAMALVREEAEDIWAEAQSVSRGTGIS